MYLKRRQLRERLGIKKPIVRRWWGVGRGHHSWRIVEKPDITEPHRGKEKAVTTTGILLSVLAKHKEIVVGDLWALSKNITTSRRESTFLFYNRNPILC